VILPVDEVQDEIFPDLAGGILPGICVETFPISYGIERCEADREQDPLSETVSKVGAEVIRRVMILLVASESPDATRGIKYRADC
jgi:hypothetical protein